MSVMFVTVMSQWAPRCLKSPASGLFVKLSSCSGLHQIKHQSSASLAFVRRINRMTDGFPSQRASNAEMFPFDDVIMWCDVPRYLQTVALTKSCLTRAKIQKIKSSWDPHIFVLGISKPMKILHNRIYTWMKHDDTLLAVAGEAEAHRAGNRISLQSTNRLILSGGPPWVTRQGPRGHIWDVVYCVRHLWHMCTYGHGLAQ